MNLVVTILMLIVLWLFMTLGTWLWVIMTAKSTGVLLKSAEFADKISEESGQIVDVRESASYKRSHIMGARNMPAMNFTQGKSGLRKDRDIFLYGERLRDVIRASKSLKKQGYDKHNIFLLRGGFAQYNGKKTK